MQLVAATPCALCIEFFPSDNPIHDFLHALLKVPRGMKEPVDSSVEVPQAPGLGYEIDEEVAAKTRVA